MDVFRFSGFILECFFPNGKQISSTSWPRVESSLPTLYAVIDKLVKHSKKIKLSYFYDELLIADCTHTSVWMAWCRIGFFFFPFVSLCNADLIYLTWTCSPEDMYHSLFSFIFQANGALRIPHWWSNQLQVQNKMHLAHWGLVSTFFCNALLKLSIQGQI